MLHHIRELVTSAVDSIYNSVVTIGGAFIVLTTEDTILRLDTARRLGLSEIDDTDPMTEKAAAKWLRDNAPKYVDANLKFTPHELTGFAGLWHAFEVAGGLQSPDGKVRVSPGELNSLGLTPSTAAELGRLVGDPSAKLNVKKLKEYATVAQRPGTTDKGRKDLDKRVSNLISGARDRRVRVNTPPTLADELETAAKIVTRRQTALVKAEKAYEEAKALHEALVIKYQQAQNQLSLETKQTEKKVARKAKQAQAQQPTA